MEDVLKVCFVFLVVAVVVIVLLSGCATAGGQVGSNAAYVYESTPDGGCRVTVFSGREQIESATILISKDCELTGDVKAVTAGQTSAKLIEIVDRLVPAP